MRRRELAVQQSEDARHLLVARHRVGDADARVEARQRRTDEGEHDGHRHDQGEGRARSAEHLVADRVDDVTDRRSADACCAVAAQSRPIRRFAGDRRATDDVVRGEVLEQVADAALDQEA